MDLFNDIIRHLLKLSVIEITTTFYFITNLNFDSKPNKKRIGDMT